MILDRAKAWVALIGAILVAVLSSDNVDLGQWRDEVTIASVIATAVATYLVPNKDTPRSEEV